MAIRGERIVAVGTNQEIGALPGLATRRIDLRGRAVIPASSTTTCTCCGPAPPGSTRCAGTVSSRGRRRSRCFARAPSGRSRANGSTPRRLGNRAVRRRPEAVHARGAGQRSRRTIPVFLQASYFEAYLNSRGAAGCIGGFGEAGTPQRTAAPDPRRRSRRAGRPTGRSSEDGFRALVGKLPTPPPRRSRRARAA